MYYYILCSTNAALFALFLSGPIRKHLGCAFDLPLGVTASASLLVGSIRVLSNRIQICFSS